MLGFRPLDVAFTLATVALKSLRTNFTTEMVTLRVCKAGTDTIVEYPGCRRGGVLKLDFGQGMVNASTYRSYKTVYERYDKGLLAITPAHGYRSHAKLFSRKACTLGI